MPKVRNLPYRTAITPHEKPPPVMNTNLNKTCSSLSGCFRRHPIAGHHPGLKTKSNNKNIIFITRGGCLDQTSKLMGTKYGKMHVSGYLLLPVVVARIRLLVRTRAEKAAGRRGSEPTPPIPSGGHNIAPFFTFHQGK